MCLWFFSTITREGQNFTCMGHQVKKSMARVKMILKMLWLFLRNYRLLFIVQAKEP